MPKAPLPAPAPPECKESLGQSPAVLAKRDIIHTESWCPNPNQFDYDKFCDPKYPKTVHFSQILKAHDIIKEYIPPTLLTKSKCCKRFSMELYFKVETFHRTGSFHERAAIYSLVTLTPEQRHQGVVTASVGNWAMALAYQAYLFNIRVTVVLPVVTAFRVVDKCKSYGAHVLLYGNNFAEAKQRAFTLIAQSRGFYLNGFDHPHVIAGDGSVGIEIMQQLPDVEAILVPVGGGGLLAGVAAAVKHQNRKVLIYGIETVKSCGFFKAMDNENPYQIESQVGLANSLIVPKPGENAFHTARSLIDKMVLVDDDWIARAVLHLLEQENLVSEGAGAIALGSLLCLPDILPELHGKKVVCIVSGGNLEIFPMIKVITRAKIIEGCNVSLTVRISGGRTDYERRRIFKALKSLNCNITVCDLEREWLTEDKLIDSYVSIQFQTRNFKHALTVKNVMDKLFPNVCEFCEDTFKDIATCACFPRKM
ncbi:uncharacterized protein LOC113504741 [Trichoplusia ni]|uniref:L-serine deaminase n=1 Tax=Trichoplusia ni TaxID=7111 RepID=A0A7E5WQE9_TRINI|nr:uncharacterized protein LOC113504741 [Trichoplusia ni]